MIGYKRQTDRPEQSPQERRDDAIASLQETAALALLESIQESRTHLEESWELIGRGRGSVNHEDDYHPLRFNYGPIVTPYSYIDDRHGQRLLPWYENEWDLRALRSQCRLLDAFSTMAIGAKAQLVNYTFGGGWTQTVVPENDDISETPLSKEANRILELVLQENGWGRDYKPYNDGSPATSLDMEVAEACITDEALVTLNESGGEIRIDLEDPNTLTEPANKAGLEHWLERTGRVPHGAVHSWWYGIHTINRRRGRNAFVQDQRRPAGYHFSFTEAGDEWDYKPTSEVVHFKRNVPGKAPRGVSDYVPILCDLEKDPKLMSAMASGEIARQNIVYVRQIMEGKGGSHSDLDSILSNAAGGTINIPARNSGQQTKNVERLDQTRIPTLRGAEYKSGPDGRSVSAAVEVQQALRRSIGIRWSMNEGFISMDFSNNNLASQLAAESPFVIARQRDQAWFGLNFQELYWKILMMAHRKGMFGRGRPWKEIVSELKIVIEMSEVASRDPLQQMQRDEVAQRVYGKSRRTIATEHGDDFDAEQQNREKDGDPEPAGPMGTPQGGGGLLGGMESNRGQNVPSSNADNSLSPAGGPASPFSKRIHESLIEQIRGNLLEGGSHDQKTHGRKGGGSPRTPTRRPKKPKTKSEIAKANAKYVGREIQRYSEERNEPVLAKALGGKSLEDNEPMDVVVSIDGKQHGIELKTMVDNGNNKLTMKRSAIERKNKWARKNKAAVHTVVFDDQEVFNAGGPGKHDDSKRRIFYRRGSGSMRVSAMHEVKDMDELKTLMKMNKRKLPKGAA